MKANKLTVILIMIIIILLGIIILERIDFKGKDTINEDDSIVIVDNIKLPYVTIYLDSNGDAYLVPLSENEIEKINGGTNLKERLTTLYNRAFYYDIYVNNYKIKGFRVQLDSNIKKISKIDTSDNTYIIFLKENNTIGIFNYSEYHNLLYTKVIDNYLDLKDILDIIDNKIVYLDGSKSELKLEDASNN